MLIDVTGNAVTIGWPAALKRALDDLAEASGMWPDAPSRSKHEPPPGNDNGALTASIETVRSTLGAALKSLAGKDSGPPPEPGLIADDEPSEISQLVQYWHDLADDLATYARVTTKPFSPEDHAAAVAAAGELLDVPDIVLLQSGLSMFADLAARVARNATRDEWTTLIEDAAQLEPLLHAVDMLVAYRDFHEQIGNSELADLAFAAIIDRLATLPQQIQGEDFWTSTSGGGARRLLQRWASMDDCHNASELLGLLARDSRTGLCRMLDVLASTIERTDTFTDEVQIVREVHNRFGSLSSLVRPDEIRAAIAQFVPEASNLNPWEVVDQPECVRFAAQFLATFPA